MTVITKSEVETIQAGRAFGAGLSPGTIVAMYGDLGAGKTAFIRGLAQGLQLNVRVSSPTFTIVNEYLGPIPLFHFDMYRLKSADELFDIGWDDYMDRNGVCAVEWSENVEDAFPPETIRVKIDKLNDTDREIKIDMPILGVNL